MQILINVPDDFALEDGDAFDAVRDALEHFEIPSAIRVIPATEIAVQAFVKGVAGLKMWDYGNDPEPFGECPPPSEGYADSHTCLMDLIEQARELMGTANKPIVITDSLTIEVITDVATS